MTTAIIIGAFTIADTVNGEYMQRIAGFALGCVVAAIVFDVVLIRALWALALQ